MIIAPKLKIIEPRDELVVPGTAAKGFFKMEAVNRFSGKRRVLADWFPNLITTAGLNFMGGGSSYMSYCAVGTGNTAPAITDTALASQVGSRTADSVSINAAAQPSSPYYSDYTKTMRFAEGVAAGNLAEVGLFSASSGGTMWSRALILDGLGDPTTITVLSDEFLDVTYQLRWYQSEVDVEGMINISGTDHDYILRTASITAVSSGSQVGTGAGIGSSSAAPVAYSGNIGDITSTPAGSPAQLGTGGGVSLQSYSADSFYRDAIVTFALTGGNVDGGIRSILFYLGNVSSSTSNLGRQQIQFDPVIPKDGTKILTLTLRHLFARKAL